MGATIKIFGVCQVVLDVQRSATTICLASDPAGIITRYKLVSSGMLRARVTVDQPQPHATHYAISLHTLHTDSNDACGNYPPHLVSIKM